MTSAVDIELSELLRCLGVVEYPRTIYCKYYNILSNIECEATAHSMLRLLTIYKGERLRQCLGG